MSDLIKIINLLPWLQVGGTAGRKGCVIPCTKGWGIANPSTKYFKGNISPTDELANFCQSMVGQLASNIKMAAIGGSHVVYYVFGYSRYVQVTYPCDKCRQKGSGVDCNCHVIADALFAEKEALRIQSFDKSHQFQFDLQRDFTLRKLVFDTKKTARTANIPDYTVAAQVVNKTRYCSSPEFYTAVAGETLTQNDISQQNQHFCLFLAVLITPGYPRPITLTL